MRIAICVAHRVATFGVSNQLCQSLIRLTRFTKDSFSFWCLRTENGLFKCSVNALLEDRCLYLDTMADNSKGKLKSLSPVILYSRVVTLPNSFLLSLLVNVLLMKSTANSLCKIDLNKFRLSVEGCLRTNVINTRPYCVSASASLSLFRAGQHLIDQLPRCLQQQLLAGRVIEALFSW